MIVALFFLLATSIEVEVEARKPAILLCSLPSLSGQNSLQKSILGTGPVSVRRVVSKVSLHFLHRLTGCTGAWSGALTPLIYPEPRGLPPSRGGGLVILIVAWIEKDKQLAC